MAASTSTVWLALLAGSGILCQQLARSWFRLDLRSPMVAAGLAGLVCAVAASSLPS